MLFLMRKAFDEVLHNVIYKTLLLKKWYDNLRRRVRLDNVLRKSFVVKCGVRQGGVLSPYLFAIYIDDLIAQLKQSGHGIYIEQLFVGCVCYADDIALLSASCYGLQKLVDIDIRSSYGISWDIKFNPLKSQLITFGGCNPAQCVITINGNSIPWVPKVKYLGIFSHCYY